MEIRSSGSPDIAREQTPDTGCDWHAPTEAPLFPEWYLGELVTSHAQWLKDAHGQPKEVIRSLTSLTRFMRHRTHPDQRFDLGRRVLARAAGEQAALPEINEWLTTGATGARHARVIASLSEYILREAQDAGSRGAASVLPTEPDPASTGELPAESPQPELVPWSPRTVGSAEQASAFDAAVEELDTHGTVLALATFVSVGEDRMLAFVDHFTRCGSLAGDIAVRRVTVELQRLLDQYDAQAPDELRNDARYAVIRNFVEGLIGYDGQSPKAISHVLADSPYFRSSTEMSKAYRQIIALLKEMLRCEVIRDPENITRFQNNLANLHAGKTPRR